MVVLVLVLILCALFNQLRFLLAQRVERIVNGLPGPARAQFLFVVQSISFVTKNKVCLVSERGFRLKRSSRVVQRDSHGMEWNEEQVFSFSRTGTYNTGIFFRLYAANRHKKLESQTKCQMHNWSNAQLLKCTNRSCGGVKTNTDLFFRKVGMPRRPVSTAASATANVAVALVLSGASRVHNFHRLDVVLQICEKKATKPHHTTPRKQIRDRQTDRQSVRVCVRQFCCCCCSCSLYGFVFIRPIQLKQLHACMHAGRQAGRHDRTWSRWSVVPPRRNVFEDGVVVQDVEHGQYFFCRIV